jgi:hypothetical protein
MDFTGEDVLAGTAFAGEQNGGITCGGLAGGIEQLAHRGAAGFQERTVLDGFAQNAVLDAEAADFERAFDDVLDLLERERLGQVIEGAGLHRFNRVFDGGVSGHQDHGDIGNLAAGLLEQLDAVDPGHPVVSEDQIERVGAGQLNQSLLSGLGRAGLIAAALKEGREMRTDVFFVVNDQDSSHD